MTTRKPVLARLAPAAAVCLLAVTSVPAFADSPSGTCSPDGTKLALIALDGKFDKKCLAAPTGQAFTIDFKNLDRGLPHNVAIYRDRTARAVLFQGDLVDGPGLTTYSVPALPAGRWFFRCDPHPDMNGTFVVGGP
jgi:plastocyanin